MDERDASARDCRDAMIRALVRTADVRHRYGRYAEAARLYEQALALCDAGLDTGLDTGIDTHTPVARAAIVKRLALAEGACRHSGDGE